MSWWALMIGTLLFGAIQAGSQGSRMDSLTLKDILHCNHTNHQGGPEFGQGNGFIYSDGVILRLAMLADSLNAVVRARSLDREYHSVPQARARYVSLYGDDAAAAMDDIRQQIPLEEFLVRHPSCKVVWDVLVSCWTDTTARNTGKYEYTGAILGMRNDYVIRSTTSPEDLALANGGWVANYDGTCRFRAFMFAAGPVSQRITERYGRMIRYVDHMIDTATTLHIVAPASGIDTVVPASSNARYASIRNARSCIAYLHALRGHSREKAQLWGRTDLLDPMRVAFLDSLMAAEPSLREVFVKVADHAALTATSPGEEFEELVARYYSANVSLDLKRGRRVRGECSQDRAPRFHAVRIAQRAAIAFNWKVFMRAHMDVLCDRFDRRTDGSYAQKERGTYAGELRAIHVDAPALLLGTIVRFSSPPRGHYFAGAYRIGRALAETMPYEQWAGMLLGMIGDTELDDYNRMLFYYVLRSCNATLDNSLERYNNEEKAVRALPAYMADALRLQPQK